MTRSDLSMMARCLAAAAAIPLLAAQTTTLPERPPVREISLLAGRGELLRFDRDLTKVAVAEEKIAEVVLVSPREVMVNAKSPGRTTVMIWEGDLAPEQFNVNV